MKRPRVVLADDHRILLDALERVLEPVAEVAGAVTDGRSLLAVATELRPDVIVLDIGMPLLDGLEAARQLRSRLPRTRLIILTMSEDPDLAAEALRVGVSGYVLKHSAASELRTAVREVVEGRVYVSPQLQGALEEAVIKRGASAWAPPRLTDRQREVLQLLADGRTMKEVAVILHLTPRTVAFHKYRIMEVLRTKTTAELILFAAKHHLVSR